MAGSHNMQERLSGKYLAKASGKILKRNGEARIAWGPTVTDDESGYAYDCIFFHTDGSGANDAVYLNIGTGTLSEWVPFTPGLGALHMESIGLAEIREVVSNDIYLMGDTPASSDAFGSLLTKNSTPILEMANGDTDSALRLNWASSNSDPVIFQTALHPYLDVSSVVEIHFRAAMAAVADTPTIASDVYFNEGDTKVEDVSAAVTGATVAEYTITIAAADVPSGAQTLTVELTPGAHTTDALYVYAVWVQYTKVRS